MTSPTISHFSCDLVEESKKHIAFLKTVHLNSISIQKPSNDSFRRYSQLWLPLVYRHYLDTNSSAEQQQSPQAVEGLIPPADIAWLWHCHRLAPYRYAKHVQRRFFSNKQEGTKVEQSTNKSGITYDNDIVVLDPKYPFVVQFQEGSSHPHNDTFDAAQHTAAAEYTQSLWQQMYPSEPFFGVAYTNEEQKCSNHEDDEDATDYKLSGFDVVESCQRQAAFLWQVSQSSFKNDSFLEQGVENYFKFMSLMKRDKDKPRFLVPTYQIDLMWHTHILSSIKRYHHDCMNTIHTILEHDDSLTDRSDGGVLDTNFQATKSLWLDVYGKEYKVPGGMYRGEPPKAFFQGKWAKGNGLKSEVSATRVFVLPGVTLAHLIGEVGASSAGRDGESPLTWMSINDSEAFIAPEPKSTVKGVNANPRKGMYVFGTEVKGVGYYHLHTKEAYQVILNRLADYRSRSSQISTYCCVFILCSIFFVYFMRNVDKKRKVPIYGWLGIIAIVVALVSLCYWSYSRQREAELKNVEVITTLRMNAAGPSSPIDLPPGIVEKLKASKIQRRNYDSNNASDQTLAYYHGGYNYFDEVVCKGTFTNFGVGAAAACGAQFGFGQGGDGGGGGSDGGGGGACGSGACGGGGGCGGGG